MQPREKDNILLATAESATLKAAFEMLQSEGYSVLGCTSLRCARCIFAALMPGIAVVDYVLPEGDAGDLLKRAKQRDRELKCIVLADARHLSRARNAVRDLGFRVVAKPLEERAFRHWLRVNRDSLRRRGQTRSRSARSGSQES